MTRTGPSRKTGAVVFTIRATPRRAPGVTVMRRLSNLSEASSAQSVIATDAARGASRKKTWNGSSAVGVPRAKINREQAGERP